LKTQFKKRKIMGLNTQGEGGIYLSVANGKIIRQHQNAIEGKTTARVNKLGKTVHEQKFDSIDGTMTSLTVKYHQEYGKQYTLTIQDGDDKFLINIQRSSRYATALVKALPNVDLTKPVPWQMPDKKKPGKDISGITLWQDGVKILPAYTKEAPNGLPEMKKVKVKGKDTWDSFEMEEFLEKKSLEQFAKAYAPAVTTSTEVPF
jgi:hypothetical protein